MINAFKKMFIKDDQSTLAALLGNPQLRDELLGMMAPVQPKHDKILADANAIVSYTHRDTYKVWAKEAWAHVLTHLDAIQDDKATSDSVNFHRGALKATLDLLRISHQANAVKQQLDRENETNVSSAR